MMDMCDFLAYQTPDGVSAPLVLHSEFMSRVRMAASPRRWRKPFVTDAFRKLAAPKESSQDCVSSDNLRARRQILMRLPCYSPASASLAFRSGAPCANVRVPK
jgi:hypothetical protein